MLVALVEDAVESSRRSIKQPVNPSALERKTKTDVTDAEKLMTSAAAAAAAAAAAMEKWVSDSLFIFVLVPLHVRGYRYYFCCTAQVCLPFAV